ncbi:LysR family transcriptional regulator [Pseudoduganella violacea]|uniref:DNA-binding transcriptional LysR family regulator n=1 Tax=Pseudoduganella violacea TaxID=1715466 RepID=A0A7W5FVQ1_9BURK|nr:LysR family transcriptional regulator [Pseudoduganella violacea]MBB3121042.1 DNA-binding transcriptional LysR family regulator [Pseudoduganella violacea]
MDGLSSIAAFVRAAETLSYVAAGRQLGISASAVGKGVMRLEARLGVRLLQRSTRRIGLTDAGALFYERCQRILADLGEAEAEMLHLMDAPRGKLRVSTPAVYYRVLLPLLAEFMQRYPEIELELDFNDRRVDVVADGFDVVVRSGELHDSGLTARRLSGYRHLIVAAPAYFARHGQPRAPADLLEHACLHYRFHGNGKLREWQVDAPAPLPALPQTLVCNNIEALIGAALRGLGLAYLPDFLVNDYLRDGQLQAVLGEHVDDGGQFWLLWPSSRQMAPKLRVFVDFLCERLQAG